MNNRASSRRRFRVVARPLDRARRLRFLGAAGAVGLLGVIAAFAARHAARALCLARAALPLSAAGHPEVAAVDAPEPLRSSAQAVVDAMDGSAGEKAAALKKAFPCVADVAVRRVWGESRATLTPSLRSAVAPAFRRGRPAGYLGADGTVFSAPAGLYALSGPTIDVAGAGEGELGALAREWAALTASGALPAPISEMSYDPSQGGWQARLADGTTVAWGRLEWTKEKLARLVEALADARAKSPGVFAADLRWFEDGKVLLRPTSGPGVVRN